MAPNQAPQTYGLYSVTVSTRVCGTLSSGSNPDRDPNYLHLQYICYDINVRITESHFVIDSHEIGPLNPLTKKQAEQKIRGIASELCLFRSSNKELMEIEDIIRRLYGGQINPDRAVIEAEEILEVKNSYTKMYRSFLNIFNIF